ncbi:hypothetical protein MA20_42015 [Bradyrhizobium japonicum]|uniref:Uncharacterized protein n=1 Tax=Bradyrhizobium japonicum TaxID=375 RepID=A0A0A3XH64_BRAJP|nr:hypothetical protein MA20_42015 [Bradyrhizobium japonicum]
MTLQFGLQKGLKRMAETRSGTVHRSALRQCRTRPIDDKPRHRATILADSHLTKPYGREAQSQLGKIQKSGA